jgi:flagellar biosynthesis protein FlhF
MKLKTFHAKSMSEAMRQVRDALGDDAIIVSSREEKGLVRITAAVEQEPVSHEEEIFDAETNIELITETLLRHRVPAGVSDKIISACMTLHEKDPKKMLAAALRKAISFAIPGRKPIILVGPPGAGKTLMAAKLAARAVLDNKKPVVITTDIARAGGIEQLSAFLNILGVPLEQAEDAKGLKALLAKAPKSAPVIIDTGGLNPFDPQEMKFLAKLLSVAEMEPTLVLPAGIDAEESAEMALTFEVLGVKRLMPTRLDFARRLGGLLSAADRAGLAFTEGSHTPQVANGLLALTPDSIANLLLPHSPKKRAKS